MAPKKESNNKLVAENRRARFDYSLEDGIEAGVMLLGSEVKSLRVGRVNIAESYVSPEGDGLYLINANIPEYLGANRFNHEPKRKRKLLLRKREIAKLITAVEREGRTIVPLKLYFNDRGIAKLLIAAAKGKKNHDKREATKDREWKRDQGRIMRARG